MKTNDFLVKTIINVCWPMFGWKLENIAEVREPCQQMWSLLLCCYLQSKSISICWLSRILQFRHCVHQQGSSLHFATDPVTFLPPRLSMELDNKIRDTGLLCCVMSALRLLCRPQGAAEGENFIRLPWDFQHYWAADTVFKGVGYSEACQGRVQVIWIVGSTNFVL